MKEIYQLQAFHFNHRKSQYPYRKPSICEDASTLPVIFKVTMVQVRFKEGHHLSQREERYGP